MRACAIVAGVLASGALLLAGAQAAQADRLDDAGRALREPGVWVDADLSWLVGPEQARRLDRAIDRAHVPVRVAVLPRVENDESRGDQRAIVRAIIRRVDRDGLYALVDQDGDVAYAARRLPLDITEFSFPKGSGLRPAALSTSLAALVPAVCDAAPADPPVSFEPFADPKGVSLSSGGRADHDPLLGVALACLLFGAAGGFIVYVVVRTAVAGADRWRQRA